MGEGKFRVNFKNGRDAEMDFTFLSLETLDETLLSGRGRNFNTTRMHFNEILVSTYVHQWALGGVQFR